MLLFSRMSTLSGTPAEVMGAALAVTERVNEVLDHEVSLWSGGAGFPLGTTVWSTTIESHAELAETGATLMGDAKYGELVGQLNTLRVGDTNDQIREMIHGAPAGEPTGVGGVGWIVTAQPTGGNLVNAMTWGADVTDHVSGLTGAQTRLFRDLYGPFGQLTWLTTFASPADLDTAQAALAADADYLSMVDKAGAYFAEGSGHQGMASRIA